jgi:hypothetical protein
VTHALANEGEAEGQIVEIELKQNDTRISYL